MTCSVLRVDALRDPGGFTMKYIKEGTLNETTAALHAFLQHPLQVC